MLTLPLFSEIGGAFGGEKKPVAVVKAAVTPTGNRRQTNTINYSTQLPLAQGIGSTYSCMLWVVKLNVRLCYRNRTFVMQCFVGFKKPVSCST